METNLGLDVTCYFHTHTHTHTHTQTNKTHQQTSFSSPTIVLLFQTTSLIISFRVLSLFFVPLWLPFVLFIMPCIIQFLVRLPSYKILFFFFPCQFLVSYFYSAPIFFVHSVSLFWIPNRDPFLSEQSNCPRVSPIAEIVQTRHSRNL